MRRLGVWGVGTACLMGLGLTVGSRAGDLPLGGGSKSPAVRPVGGDTGAYSGAAPTRAAVEEAAQVRKREEAAYLRRVAVCDKLTAIAYQSNDTQLQEQADQLQQRAFDVYMQRIAHLPNAQAGAVLDEQVLGQTEGATAPAGSRLEPRRLVTPGTRSHAATFSLPGRGR